MHFFFFFFFFFLLQSHFQHKLDFPVDGFSIHVHAITIKFINNYMAKRLDLCTFSLNSTQLSE